MRKYSPYSEMKIFYHTDRLAGIIRGERVAPVYVRIKPTNICNQNCFYCGYANNRVFDDRKVDSRESISWEILKQALSELSEMKVKAVTYSGGGEPLAYHSIKQALEMTYKLGIDYSLITNGQALEGEVVDYLKYAKWIRVSFDSSNRETYENIRGVQTYDKVISNIENFAKKKSANCTLGINCVVSKENAQEIYEICELAKELGADNIKLSPIIVKEDCFAYHEAIKENVWEQIQRSKQMLEDETFRIVNKYSDDLIFDGDYHKKYHRCYIQEFFTVIAADSKVYRCHSRAYTKTGEIGDLTKNSFKNIWFANENIKKIREFDPCEKCQFRCTFDERNILLDDFMNMDRDHINFI